MKQLVTSFDPTAALSGAFNIGLPINTRTPNGYGTLLIANESSVSLIIQINEDRFRIHPWMLEKVVLTDRTQQVLWSQEFILSNQSTSPVSLVLVDGFTADENVTGSYPIPLIRNTNVGGTVATSSTVTLINDGSPANTTIIETTPVDQASSAFKLDNEGNLTVRTVDAGVWSTIISIIEGSGGGAATKLFHGTADIASTANAVAAANVTAGALPASVTSPLYFPSAGGSITGQVTLENPMSGSDAVLLQLESSDASPAARWTIVNRFSDTALEFVDQTNGHTPIILTPTSGSSTFFGTLSPRHGNGSFGIRGNFSGTGSGTIATGAGATPSICLIEDSQSGSSMTTGVVISGTNAVVTAGASHTWLGVAL